MTAVGKKPGSRASDEKQGLPVLAFASAAEWERWLSRNHASAAGLWIKFAKKGTGPVSFSHAEALDGALCYGWIDGQTASCDDKFWLQRFTRRGPRSIWSKINCGKVEALVAAGRVKPSGLAQIEIAKSDGRWAAAYASQRTIAIPPDLQARLDAQPRARRAFEGLDSKNRYAILFRIHGAKMPATRQRRIEQFVSMLAEGRVIYPSTLPKTRPAKTAPVRGPRRK